MNSLNKRKINFFKLIISILIAQSAGIMGSFFTVNSVSQWYGTLNKPEFNPPSWVFSPVWITLFLLMGISLYLVWRKKFKDKSRAFYFFGIQIFLNMLWSFLFFKLHFIFLAFLEIVLLFVFIFLTIYEFWKISHAAAYLLIPYALWVGFASILNFSIFLIN